MSKERVEKKKNNYFSICPKCNSLDVSIDNSDMLVGSLGIPANYICNNCQYSAKVFPEIDEEELKKQTPNTKNTKLDTKTEKIDTSYGKFTIFLWKISGPIGMITALLLFRLYLVNNNSEIILYSIIILIISAIITYLAYRKK